MAVPYGLAVGTLFLCTVAIAIVSPLIAVVMFSYVTYQISGLLVGDPEPLRLRLIPTTHMGLCLALASFAISILTAIYVALAARLAFANPPHSHKITDRRLLGLISDVSRVVGVSPFEAVYLQRPARRLGTRGIRGGTPDFLAPCRGIVYLRPGMAVATAYVGGARILVLNAIVIKYLTANELRAIVAHECAHHHHNAMMLNRVYNRLSIMLVSFSDALDRAVGAYGSWTDMLERVPLLRYLVPLRETGWLGISSVRTCFRVYMHLFLWTRWLLDNASYELYCDDVAIALCWGSVMASALQKVTDLSVASARADATWEKNREAPYLDILDNEYKRLRAEESPRNGSAVTKPSRSHPPLSLRLLRAKAARTSEPDCSEPVLDKAEADALWSTSRAQWKEDLL